MQALKIVAVSLALMMPRLSSASVRASQPDDEEQYHLDAQDANQHTQFANVRDAMPQDTENFQGPRSMSLVRSTVLPHRVHQQSAPAPSAAAAPSVSAVRADAKHAHEAAKVAKQAAKVANQVAKHSIKVTGHAKKALKHALGALHDARVESKGLDKGQKASLKKAEAHLREATKSADHGKLKKLKDEQDLKKQRMQAELDKNKNDRTEKEDVDQQIDELRKKLKEKKVNDKDINKSLDELEASKDDASNDETKAEIERLREVVDKLEDPDDEDIRVGTAKKSEDSRAHLKEHKNTKASSSDIGTQPSERSEKTRSAGSDAGETVTPIKEQGIDIDTQMPYGDLEPFGREDTAQELTESSIKESDSMVDQLERAEVAEEKRSVFRALTRLRGAAITSFDGVARSQTGNIDEYNKITKWRKSHPLHHLADEESDVSKWAFPDNAD